jgi:succinate dehydrogenase / fumarate reductase flavoprotein subunit
MLDGDWSSDVCSSDLGLADGYFIIPYTIGGYLANEKPGTVNTELKEFEEAASGVKKTIDTLLSIKGKRTCDDFHRELGKIVWDYCGMSRSAEGIAAAKEKVKALRDEFWQNVTVPGTPMEMNQTLERAGRVAEFLDFADILLEDALSRKESCGSHFNVAYQTEENEAKRDDENYAYVAAWEYQGKDKVPALHKETLVFENVHLSQRSYK